MHRLSFGVMTRYLVTAALVIVVLQSAYGQKSPHGPLKIACMDCHTTESWKEMAKPMKFDHGKTSFPLLGSHTTVQCIQCHTNNRFAGTADNCYSCHQKDFTQTVFPNHQAGKFSHDCLTCHTMTSWKPSTFQHSKTNFQLIGAHLSVECASCHTNNRFAELSTDCFSCHQKDFSRAVSPNHVQGKFSHDCLTCHTMAAWQPSTFDHNKTNFPLTGAHTSVQCASCHAGGKFAGTPMDCYSCHQADFGRTTDPNHVQSQFSHDCLTCHTMTAWQPSIFDHNKTSFPLVGSHAAVQCASCHASGQFKRTPTDCYSCHQADFGKTTDPNHVQSQFSHDCLTCHTMTAWKPATFDHNKTNFPLVGAHITVQCASCHAGGKFAGTPMDCYSCHQADFGRTTDPNHVQSQFSHDCVTCHTMTAWKPATFDHNKTNFPLTGAHAAVQCASCHAGGKFAGTPMDCYSCHQADFGRTTDPNHVQSQFSHDCLTCHTLSAWKPATFDHNKTSFPLVGAHVTVQCASCHANGKFAGTPTDCYSCHQADFGRTTDPNHVQSQFSHDCVTCHTMTAWKPATFDHNKTNFPLTGAHTATPCASCHVNGKFAGTSAECYSCHQADFTKTTDPNHVAGNFDHNCITCHTTSAWEPASFDHNKTSFPLVGAHATVQCASCHAGGKFAGTPMDCYSCHQADFGRTTDPNHVQSQFSHDCLTCHTMTAWQPSTFDHNKTNFPLTGAHTATPCASCHTNGQYAGTSKDCYTCHQSDFTGATDPNHVAGNFDHNCITCHTTSAWEPATFDHNKTSFPLTGAHTSVQCASCHAGGKFAGTPMDCYSCHQADYTNTTNPNHTAAGFPTTCQTCHTTTQWSGASFNHTWFPRNHGNSGGLCITCHTNTQDYKGFQCIDCHEHNKTDMDRKHNGRNGYTYESTACYRCHPNGRS